MGKASTPRARVNRGAVNKQKMGDRVNALDAVCSAGAQIAQITGDPVGAPALAALKTANINMRATLVSHTALIVTYRASCKAMLADGASLEQATSVYIGAVNVIAAGNAALITKAGFESYLGTTTVTAPSIPTNLHVKPGKASMTAVVGWDAAPGAGAYNLRVNFTPADPTKWQVLSPGTSRRRTVTAPTPGAQFLVGVASIGDEVTSDWTDSIMATAA